LPVDQLAYAAFAFLVAGLIKGAVGVGLPTVVVGLLSIVMPPSQAAALMVLPAIATNTWQMFAGPALGKLLRRFAWMNLAVFAGTFSTIGLMTTTGPAAGAVLGLALAAYGAYGLVGRRFHIGERAERWLSPVVGLLAGMLSGATGVFVVPTMPYLTSLRMEREELVQAIGIFAFVCPLALVLALSVNGAYRAEAAGASVLALAPAFAGMALGQWLRRRLSAESFMRWFFAAMVGLGGYMFYRNITW
jgi:uncharacterized protein